VAEYLDTPGRPATLNIGAKGYPVPAWYALDAHRLTEQLMLDGIYDIRAVVAIFKHRGAHDAYTAALDGLSATRTDTLDDTLDDRVAESVRLDAHNEYKRVHARRPRVRPGVSQQFVIRRLIQLQRDGLLNDVRALCGVLPDRDEWIDREHRRFYAECQDRGPVGITFEDMFPATGTAM